MRVNTRYINSTRGTSSTWHACKYKVHKLHGILIEMYLWWSFSHVPCIYTHARYRMYFWWSVCTYAPERVKARPRAQHGRPRRPRTAARTMEVLRRCPLAIAQQLVYYAIAVSTAVTKTMSVAPLLSNNLKQKRSSFHSPAPPPCSWSLLG